MNIDSYFANVPAATKTKLLQIRTLVHEEIPDGEEVISYGVPTVKLQGKYVVYYGGYAKHVSIYPASDSLIAAIPKAARYRKGKGTLQFSADSVIPLPLIREIVRFLLAEHRERMSKK